MLSTLKQKSKFFFKRHQTSVSSNWSKFEADYTSRCHVTMLLKIWISASLTILGHESF